MEEVHTRNLRKNDITLTSVNRQCMITNDIRYKGGFVSVLFWLEDQSRRLCLASISALGMYLLPPF